MTRLACSALLLVLAAAPAAAQQYDVLIRNGRVVDGTGNPWRHADVGIVGDRIVLVGRAGADATARRLIDARDRVVAPGFIDMLGQSEESVLIDPQAFSKITQGITTEITGEGGSIAPVNAAILAESREFLDAYGLRVDWTTLEEYFARLERQPAAINLATFVGATQVRKLVLGNDDRAPTPAELAEMRTLVDEAMRHGALGVSSSLIYAPANYASTGELIELARAAAAHGGTYISHIRNEGSEILPALDEAFRIGREAGLPVHIWHLKVSGQHNWGRMPEAVAAIERARASGLEVHADQYPYVASSTSLGAVIPPKYHAGGTDALLARLKDPAIRRELRDLLGNPAQPFENMWRGAGGPDGILVVSVIHPAELRKYEGRTIAQIAADKQNDPFDTLLDLVVATRNTVSAVYFTMSEEDLRYALKQPWVSVDTDAWAVAPAGPMGRAKIHPRSYGSFTRILGKYVREERLLTLEEAVRKMTSLAAQQVRLEDRGLLHPGYYADVTIFDPAVVADRATFDDPHQASVGIEYVLVNGTLALESGTPTGRFAGRPLRGPGYRSPPAAPAR
jgi:N-acyl-D-amino-acid deacylase